MTDPETPTPEPNSGEFADELRALGSNLVTIMREVWESEERRRFQEEIRSGLNDLSDTLNQAANDFNQSQTGQRMKEEVADLRQRIRNGEVTNKARLEILNALRTVNAELEKAAAQKRKEETTTPPPPPSDNTGQGI